MAAIKIRSSYKMKKDTIYIALAAVGVAGLLYFGARKPGATKKFNKYGPNSSRRLLFGFNNKKDPDA